MNCDILNYELYIYPGIEKFLLYFRNITVKSRD